ncbi:CDK inhibitor PHO81 homologue, putative) [Candida dubliniensis CD36]|uniref:Phosphate system positive regulatory protein, putative n=1 Tax=Candida dubliniensis (strain CD36 / ATCC MYA-646 / CBS 7987 / NCPF 3949 / NRRL Y-17841) TaxID=573826 RepID=B9WKQ5_CANDC|nr:CDK inhibitor PHO81 homologue, putative) [Candida dubliniensis CD36]CAX39604.1 CDK inhibitor PHO81 homologue, putative) [Candida dubliniensis CD36]
MKFGKYLASRQLELPEYSGHFIDYKSLKKLIKQLAIPSTTTTTTTTSIDGEVTISNIQQTLKENKASFFFRVERELEKVNSFYLEKQANLAINLNLLLMKRDELFNKSNQYLKRHGSAGDDSSLSNADINFRNSISFLNLYQNFKKIHQDLLRLQQFIELNETGFSKVVKKWDKRSKSHTKELFISTAVSVQPVFHKNEINELSDLVTQSLFDIESIMDGDYSSLSNYNASTGVVSATATTTTTTTTTVSGSTPPAPGFNIPNVPGIDEHQAEEIFTRHSSIVSSLPNNNEIDELYTSFVNVATIKEPDLSLLARWVEKINNGGSKSPEQPFTPVVKYKISKIFLLSISNLKISDSFLELFLQFINYDVDFNFINDDFNNNKTILHQCCSIPTASSQSDPNHNTSNHHPHHVTINNGVKVINSTDLINHSRTFIVKYIVEKLQFPSADEKTKLLVHKDSNGKTCLHYAAQMNRPDLLDLLLLSYPQSHIDELDNDSMSPLLLAIKHGHLNITKKLVRFGSNPFPKASKDTLQYLPINYACKFGDYKTLEYLLSNAKSQELIAKLINQQDVEGLLPLHVASRQGHYKLIKLLIQYGAQINKLDGFNKWTPIFYAAAEGHVKTTQELIKFGAKLNIIDEDGYNVLYYCVVEGHIDVINELLSYYQKGFPSSKLILDSANSTNSTSMSILGNGNDMDSGEEEEEGAPATTVTATAATTTADVDATSFNESNTSNNNVDSIPDLQLPPPILPLRRYGHNFLEQKVLIELIFPSDQVFINLFNSTADLKPGRITITSNISDIVPRNILLPIREDSYNNNGNSNNNCVFQTDVDSLCEFRIDFEIFPKFGTRLIAKTTALSFEHITGNSPEINTVSLPLFDLRLKNIGELKFSYQVIFPYSGTLLETSKFDTYWKSSTSFVKNRQTLKLNAAGGLSPNNFLSPGSVSTMPIPNNTNVNTTNNNNNGNGNAGVGVGGNSTLIPSTQSIVTATSLSGEYLRIKVCLLSDGTPIVCPNWSISITDNIDLYLPNLTLKQLNSITNDLFDYPRIIHDLSRLTNKDIPLIKKLLQIIYLPLDLVLDILNIDINLNLEIVFPSLYELETLPFINNISNNLNQFIDNILSNVFNHIRSNKKRQQETQHIPNTTNPPSTNNNNYRSIIFLSSNSLICKILNWKQPNFPVFLIMGGIAFNTKLNKFVKRTTNGLEITPHVSQSLSRDGHLRSPSSPSSLELDDLTTRSIKEAVNFTINNNLIGLITSIHLLDLVPKLIPLIRSTGLILVASSDVINEDKDKQDDEILRKELDCYTKTEINGLRFDDVLSFKEDISM